MTLDDPLNANASYDWFLRSRFGLFLHFGLYSVAGRHEWMMTREETSYEDYRARYFDRFHPDKLDFAKWAAMAKAAGMEYAVLTAKHHDGFCLYDSAHTDYKVTNTPYGQDMVRQYLEAFRAEGIKVGLYYSLLDWAHPQFTIDGHHPLRNDLKAREEPRDMAKYREYFHAQVEELVSGYGEIDVMWFDFSYTRHDWGWSKGKGKEDWDSEKVIEIIRRHQPNTILNNRLQLEGGIQTPEQFSVPNLGHEAVKQRANKLYEECHTMHGSWGYDRNNLDWKSPELLVRMLINAVSNGMNFLLNVGPDGRGQFDPESVWRLAEIGDWMDLHEPSLRNAGPAYRDPPPGCRLTATATHLYVHLFDWPYKEINLVGLAHKVTFARFLHDGAEVRVRDNPGLTHAAGLDTTDLEAVALVLPPIRPEVHVPVIELELVPGVDPRG